MVTGFTDCPDQNRSIFLSLTLRCLNLMVVSLSCAQKNSHFNCLMLSLKPAGPCSIYHSLKFIFVVENTPQVPRLEIPTGKKFINTSILMERCSPGGETGTDQPAPECFLSIIFRRSFGEIIVVVHRNHRFG